MAAKARLMVRVPFCHCPHRGPVDLWPGYRLCLLSVVILSINGSVNRKTINLKEVKLLTIRQIKAARALLGWSQGDLAHHSSISEPTIARLESAEGELAGRATTAEKIQKALEKAGIDFIEQNGGGPGVRLRRRQQLRRTK